MNVARVLLAIVATITLASCAVNKETSYNTGMGDYGELRDPYPNTDEYWDPGGKQGDATLAKPSK